MGREEGKGGQKQDDLFLRVLQSWPHEEKRKNSGFVSENAFVSNTRQIDTGSRVQRMKTSNLQAVKHRSVILQLNFMRMVGHVLNDQSSSSIPTPSQRRCRRRLTKTKEDMSIVS